MEENIQNTATTNNSQKQVAGAIVLAGALIAGALLLKGNTPVPSAVSTDNQAGSINTEARAVSPDEHIIGNSNAPIVIIEYSDTECPFCKVFHTTMHNVVEKNNGNVSWVYRHYPIPELHPKAFHESEATECAWEQGGNDAFWKYIDEVFTRTESNNKLDVAELPKIAKDIGLNTTTFNICLESGKHTNKVQSDIDDGIKAGATGTPYSLIVVKKDITTKTQTEILKALNVKGAVSFDTTNKNIMSMNGALPPEMVKKIIDILLK